MKLTYILIQYLICFSAFAVPDPDPKQNDTTLLGIDVDSNGIRDDVQNYILKTYKANPELIKAMNQFAISIQRTLATIDNKEHSIMASHASLVAANCVHYTIKVQGKSLEEAITEPKKIRFMLLNTKLRIEASMKADEFFHGQVHELSNKEQACLFSKSE